MPDSPPPSDAEPPPSPPLQLQPCMRRGDSPRLRPMPADTARNLEALLPDLRRVARRLTRSWGEADDLVQETLLRVWSRLALQDDTPVEDMRAIAFAALRNRSQRRDARDLKPAE